MTVRTVAVALKAQVGDYVSGLATGVRATKGFNDELAKLGKESPHKLNDIAMAAGGMGLALVGAAGYAVKASMDFDKQMSEVGAVAGATNAEMGKLRAAALEAGKATQFSATEAAQAEAELAKAGLTTSEILGGALTGSMNLAAAGSLSLAEAADVTAKTLNIFHLEGKDASHIADLLAAAANKSATDVHEMGMALKMGGLAAYAAGLSVEDTTGTLALFADNALVGSDAGTSLKTMLMMLQNPTIKATNAMKELGIEVYDTQGNFIGIQKLAGVLRAQLGSLTQEQRNQALATIFGSDAMRAANILFEAGSDKVGEYVDAVNQQGAAQDVAAKKTDNLSGDIERLKGSIETLAIESGSGANGGIRTLTQSANSMVDAFAAIPAPLQEAMTIVAGVAGLGIAGAAGFVKLRQTGGEMLSTLSGMGPGGEKAAKGIEKAAGATAKFAAVAAVAVVGINLVGAAWQEFVDQPKDTKMTDLNRGLIEFAKTGKAGAGTVDLFGKNLERLDRDLAALNNNKPDNFAHRWSAWIEGISGTGGVDGTFTKAKANIAQMDQALADLANGGHADEAAQAFSRIAEEAKKNGVNITELKAGLPLYQAALDGVNTVQQKSIEVTEGQNLSTQLLRGSLNDAMVALGSFKDMFDRFNGGAISLSKATSAAEESIDGMAETLGKAKVGLDKTGTSFDLTTEAGRSAQAALIKVAESSRDVAQAVYDQTGDVDQAAATFDNYKKQLIETMVQSGMNRQVATNLAEAYMKIPPTIVTRVMLFGTDDADRQIQMIKDSLARVPGSKTINITVKGQLPSGMSMGNLMHQADGGTVDFYAGGGIRDRNRVAQIAPAGAWRVWAEPETQGEAYIPFAPAKRARSTEVLAEANKRLGYPLTGKPAGNAGPYATVLSGGGNRAAVAGAVQVVEHRHVIEVEGTGLLRGLRREIRVQGGNVQQVLGQGGR